MDCSFAMPTALRTALVLSVSVSSVAAQALDEIMVPSTTLRIEDMHSAYSSIFLSGNRNAASHLWATWILGRRAATQVKTVEELGSLFSGFCPVSGSPIGGPSPANRYKYTLRTLSGGTTSGFMHHCCAPCVCDTLDMIQADTKTVRLADGRDHEIIVAVIGDPCKNAAELARPFNDPFSGRQTTLGAVAPEVKCGEASGKLEGATYSDRGGVILGMLQPLSGAEFQDTSTSEVAGYCSERAHSGYNSGMGVIFREVPHSLRPRLA